MKSPEPVGLVFVLEEGLASSRRNRIRARLRRLGVEVTYVEGGARDYFEIRGDELPVRTLTPEHWDGVDRVVPLTPDYPHAAWGPTGRDTLVSPTLVAVGGPEVRFSVGAGQFVVIAGPCAIEDEERALRIAEAVKSSGAVAFRGGAFKPRTSPYAFQGLEAEGLRILAVVKERVGVPIATEILDGADIERVCEVADLLQVGSRNMQNHALLKKLGRLRVPVLLKRGYAATVDELLLAAEYLLSGGNDQVILCERGIRSAAGSSGVILDLGAIPELKRRTHLPVIVDPSHGSQASHRVPALARAAAAAGADGLLVEVHDAPEEALSDGKQALRLDEFASLMSEVGRIRAALAGEVVDGGAIETSVTSTPAPSGAE